MFKNYPISTVRFAAIALILYYLLDVSSETIRVSSALEQRQYVLQDLIRYFLLLFFALGFWKLYRLTVRGLGRWAIVTLVLTAVFGIIAYVSLSLNLLLVSEASWQRPLLSFFEILKAEFGRVFQAFFAGQLSLQDWILAYFRQLELQFIPQVSDFPTGLGWAKLYLLFKLVASLLVKLGVVLACSMFLFVRPLAKQNLLVAFLCILWLLSPLYGGSLSALWSWLLNIKPFNGDALNHILLMTMLLIISVRMWIDAPNIIVYKAKKAKKTRTTKTKKRSIKKK